MGAKSKEELKKEISVLNEKYNNYVTRTNDKIAKLNENIKELKHKNEEHKEDADYKAWLRLNYEHLSRFIKENMDICVEEESDYYGSSWINSSLELRKPSEIE